MSEVCRCTVVGSVTPDWSARPKLPSAMAAACASPRPDAAASRCWYSASVKKALLVSHGGGGGPPGRPPPRQRYSGTVPTNDIGHIPVRSGSPQGVLGCAQLLGVSMKWLASLAGPACPLAVTAKSAAARPPRRVCLRARRVVDIRTILPRLDRPPGAHSEVLMVSSA